MISSSRAPFRVSEARAGFLFAVAAVAAGAREARARTCKILQVVFFQNMRCQDSRAGAGFCEYKGNDRLPAPSDVRKFVCGGRAAAYDHPGLGAVRAVSESRVECVQTSFFVESGSDVFARVSLSGIIYFYVHLYVLKRLFCDLWLTRSLRTGHGSPDSGFPLYDNLALNFRPSLGALRAACLTCVCLVYCNISPFEGHKPCADVAIFALMLDDCHFGLATFLRRIPEGELVYDTREQKTCTNKRRGKRKFAFGSLTACDPRR